MRKVTLKIFIASSSVPRSLVRAVIRQIGGWESFKESAEDIANHGADAGWRGFTYYADTVKFAQKNLDEIMDLATAQATEYGYDGAFSMVAEFNCLRDSNVSGDVIARLIYRRAKSEDEDDDKTLVLNTLAGFALEETARSYCDLIKQ